jgi:rapamycin-insensitive companion of mTOR
MSTAVGFRYLYQADYIEREMNAWFHVSFCLQYLSSASDISLSQERNYHYVVQIEVYLAKAFSPNGLDDEDDLL